MSALQLLSFYSAALLALVLAMGWASGIGALALFTALLGIVAGGVVMATAKHRWHGWTISKIRYGARAETLKR